MAILLFLHDRCSAAVLETLLGVPVLLPSPGRRRRLKDNGARNCLHPDRMSIKKVVGSDKRYLASHQERAADSYHRAPYAAGAADRARRTGRDRQIKTAGPPWAVISRRGRSAT